MKDWICRECTEKLEFGAFLRNCDLIFFVYVQYWKLYVDFNKSFSNYLLVFKRHLGQRWALDQTVWTFELKDLSLIIDLRHDSFSLSTLVSPFSYVYNLQILVFDRIFLAFEVPSLFCISQGYPLLVRE